MKNNRTTSSTTILGLGIGTAEEIRYALDHPEDFVLRNYSCAETPTTSRGVVAENPRHFSVADFRRSQFAKY